MSTRLEISFTDVRKTGDLRWLRPAGETQVTIEYVPQVMEEIIEVVRLIPQVLRSAAHRGADLSTSPYHESWKK